MDPLKKIWMGNGNNMSTHKAIIDLGRIELPAIYDMDCKMIMTVKSKPFWESKRHMICRKLVEVSIFSYRKTFNIVSAP